MTEPVHWITLTGSVTKIADRPFEWADFQVLAAIDYPSLLLNHDWFHFLLMLCLVLFNGFFVAVEVALIKLHPSQLENLEDKDEEAVALTRRILDNLDRYIPACKFGASIAGVLLGAVSVPFLITRLKPLVERIGFPNESIELFVTFLISLAVVLALLVVVGKVIPNSIGFRRELSVSLKCSRLLHWFYLVFALPVSLLTWFSNWFMASVLNVKPAAERVVEHNAENLKIYVEESKDLGVTKTEKEIMINALELNDLRVRDVVTPRSDVVALDIKNSFDENIQMAIESRHTRFPLINEHLDDTIGHVHIKDLIRLSKEEDPQLPRVRRDIIRVDDEVKLDGMLRTFLDKKAHLALVVDRYGGATGVVMLNDVLKVLIGDFEEGDPDVEESQIKRINDNEIEVPGSMPLHELDDEVPELDFESEEVSTVGGYVTTVLGHLPKKGETTEIDGFRVKVLEADERKIVSLNFQRILDSEKEERGEGDQDASPQVNSDASQPADKKVAAG